jgi:metal-dependent amidase/aminoacylase/carboxypeptidase family protein
MLKEEIHQMVLELFPNVVQWRRELHKIPELAFEEFETAAFVSKILTQYNISHQTQIAKTGIVALIEGKNPNKRCIALRADLDALTHFRRQYARLYF